MRHSVRQIHKTAFLLSLGSAAFIMSLTVAYAKPQPWITPTLPAKKVSKSQKKPKKVYIDFTTPTVFSNTGSINDNLPLETALQKSDRDLNQALQNKEERVQSRIIVPAPQGDLSEIFPATPPVPKRAPPTLKSKPMTAKTEAPKPIAPKAIAVPIIPTAPIVFTEPQIINVEKSALDNTLSNNDNSEPESSKIESVLIKENSTPKSLANTLTFFRTGYLDAHYKKFDNRMKDGATYIGLGAAHSFQTSWGEFEARASLDIYHAMDQSTSIDNIRMFSTRTEVAYWITKSRVKPALTLGLGWADYAVKSYRSITSDSEGPLVTTRTHAKSQAFAIIPGSSLRIEINDDIVIDTQTEFLGLLGGDSPDGVQGLSFGISLGWRL